jgi:hypothetical protein
MPRPRIRRFSFVCFFGSVVVGGAALASHPASADAQTVECFVRVCTVYPNGDRICSEKKIDCKTVAPSVPG